MDFLGLKNPSPRDKGTLSRCQGNVNGIELDAEMNSYWLIVQDYELFQRAERDSRVSSNMNLQGCKEGYMQRTQTEQFCGLMPWRLYRPGSLAYILSFTKRKHGTEVIDYDLDDMKNNPGRDLLVFTASIRSSDVASQKIGMVIYQRWGDVLRKGLMRLKRQKRWFVDKMNQNHLSKLLQEAMIC